MTPYDKLSKEDQKAKRDLEVRDSLNMMLWFIKRVFKCTLFFYCLIEMFNEMPLPGVKVLCETEPLYKGDLC